MADLTVRNDYSSEELVTGYDKWFACTPYPSFAWHNSLHYFGPSIEGKTVADYGCGSGSFLRVCAAKGAALALGVEYSAPQIVEGEKLDRAAGIAPGRIQYFHGSCLAPFTTKPNSVDVATSQYMLNDCATKEEMAHFYRNVYNDLKPGGRMLTVLTPYIAESELDRRLWISLWGIDLPVRSQLAVTDPVRFLTNAYYPVEKGSFNPHADVSEISVPEKPVFTFDGYLWSTESVIEVMRAEKFVEIEEVPLQVPDGTDSGVTIALSRMRAKLVLVGGKKSE